MTTSSCVSSGKNKTCIKLPIISERSSLDLCLHHVAQGDKNRLNRLRMNDFHYYYLARLIFKQSCIETMIYTQNCILFDCAV